MNKFFLLVTLASPTLIVWLLPHKLAVMFGLVMFFLALIAGITSMFRHIPEGLPTVFLTAFFGVFAMEFLLGEPQTILESLRGTTVLEVKTEVLWGITYLTLFLGNAAVLVWSEFKSSS